MATSGTTTWNPDIGELVEEAYERAGLELRSGYDLKTARRSLNFLLAEWANKGLNLWTVNTGTLTLVAGQKTYTTADGLPADAVDYIEHVCRTASGGVNTDISLNRISVSTYANIPTKDQTGRPYQIYVDRATAAPKITLWPVPDSSTTYTLTYWYLKRMDDATNPVSQTIQVPFRFYNALVAGLAYQVALKKPEAAERISMLKDLYDEAFQLAADEDRDRASNRFVPFVGYDF
jgi:hypothetical protein